MSSNTIRISKYLLGTYLIAGGLFSFFYILNTLGVLGFLYSLIPAVITSLVIFLFIISGYKYAFTTGSTGLIMMKISLWIQTVQLIVLGVVFKNYFGIYIAIGFTDTPDINFISAFQLLTAKFGNGFDKSSDEISVSINLVALLLLIFVHLIEKKEKSKEDEIQKLTIEGDSN